MNIDETTATCDWMKRFFTVELDRKELSQLMFSSKEMIIYMKRTIAQQMADELWERMEPQFMKCMAEFLKGFEEKENECSSV